MPKVKSAEGFILTNSRGGPHRHDNMGASVRRVLRDLSRDTGSPRFAQLRPHELRATFITLAQQAAADERCLQRFVGHSPGDVMGQHYTAITLDDMRARVVDVFLGVYGEKLNAETAASCCTIAAQTRPPVSPDERVSAVK